MRLINVQNLTFVEVSVSDMKDHYAILSHTWDVEEVSFTELSSFRHVPEVRLKRGFAKIEGACRQAEKDRLDFLWVDTCCIDKSSSAELSEAINSMYQYYRNATVCYVYLADVAGGHYTAFSRLETVTTTKEYLEYTHQALEGSRWFTRGWTLQELIAPKWVEFYDSSWASIGSKSQLAQELARITSIDQVVLENPESVASFALAKRMSWMAYRRTTRSEDMAYALLGLFDVFMPLLYGEGSRAFERLQREIMRMTTDQSLLAWEPYLPEHTDLLLAPHPFCFRNAKTIDTIANPASDDAFDMSNRGLTISLPVRDFNSHFVAALNCRIVDSGSQRRDPVVIKLLKLPPSSETPTTDSVCKIERQVHTEARPSLQDHDADFWMGGVLSERKQLTILTTTAAMVVTIEFFLGPGFRIQGMYPIRQWHENDKQFRLESQPGTSESWGYVVVQHINSGKTDLLCFSQSLELRYSLPPLKLGWASSFKFGELSMNHETVAAAVNQASLARSGFDHGSGSNVFARVFTSDYTRLIKIWKA